LYGKNFKILRLVIPACKIRETVGIAKVVDQGTMKCTVENMPLVLRDETLPASVPLNSLWTLLFMELLRFI